MQLTEKQFDLKLSVADDDIAGLSLRKNVLDLYTTYGSFQNSSRIQASVSDNEGTLDLNILNTGGHIKLENDNLSTGRRVFIKLYEGDSVAFAQEGGDASSTRYVQTQDKFVFRNLTAVNDFRLIGLPASSSSADSALVIDNNGQVKKRAQSPAPALTIVSGSASDLTATVDAVTKLPNLAGAGSHSVTLPTAASYAGKKIYLWNMNGSSNSWTFSSSVTLPDGTTSNTIPNQSTIELLSDGAVWIKWK